MKIIKNIFDNQRHHFASGGKLEKLKPLFEAAETFFFTPGISTARNSHVRDNLDLKRFMIIVLIALMPPLFFGIYNAGYQSNLASELPLNLSAVFSKGLFIVLPIILVSYLVGFFWETLFAVVRKHNISEGLLVTGLLFPLTLPPTIPLWQVALGISFGVVIGKEVFGGTGRNILNPALTARAFLFFAYPGKMSGDTVWTAVSGAGEKVVDAFSGATPLAISTLVESHEKIETILAKGNHTFATLFLGNYSGSIGETSALLCLIGAAMLIVMGIASYRIIFGGIFGVLFTGFLLNFLATDSSMAWLSLNPFYHLVMGGFAFGITYMATDPVSSPGMNRSKWIYGFAIGVLTVLIRVFNPAYAEGVMLAILFMNLFAPLLDHIEIKLRLKKRIQNV
ncbi:MAG: NADH:ubiquinone reductase (Na(+)-transporting) subunit B [Thermodesulfobacteriota bacterium]|nr:NADH:ubiquinone reductase (Na(+)-transporting) subunit B [Thermodesulfobacteriota bacterium]